MPKGSRKSKKWEKIRARKEKERQIRPIQYFVKRPPKEFEPLKERPSRFVITPGMLLTSTLPSLMDSAVPADRVFQQNPVQDHQDDVEYQRRELLALEEKERKKKMVAPLANKMGLVYVGDFPPELIRTLGRKI
jgi:hypothetical protein